MSAFSILTIFCLLIPSVFSLGFVSSQLPSIPVASKAGFAVGKVDPRLKFAPSYVQQLQPWGNRVLLSISQAETAQGFQQAFAQETRAVIVSVGTGVTDSLLVEGATVLLDRTSTCTSKWTTAAFQAAYPEWLITARAFNGKYVNGVSLNNANPLTLNGDANVAPNHFPGSTTLAGDSTLWDETAANQQDNYVLCSAGAVLGVINTASWGANRANAGTFHIQKPAVWTQKTNGYTLY